MNHVGRLRALRRRMKQEGIDGLILTHPADVRYLCGFTGSSGILGVTGHRAMLFTDGRYIAQAAQETRAARVVIAHGSARGATCRWLASTGVGHCAYDPDHMTVAELDLLRKFFPKSLHGSRRRTFLQPRAANLVSGLRLIKDEDELKLMERAARLGADLFEELLPHLRSGAPETEIAARLEYSARCKGCDGMAFDTIVAGGSRSALPHGRATAKRLPRRGFVTLDFGVILKGYCSDMTRTVFLGKATRRERFTYDAVLRAQRAAIEAVKPGVSCGDVDEAARGVLRQAGLAKRFTHSTGHGVGLEIHEAPRIAAGQPQLLKPGMVVTIEPGVYKAGQFGVRIEDMVAVTTTGARVLTPAPVDWMQL